MAQVRRRPPPGRGRPPPGRRPPPPEPDEEEEVPSGPPLWERVILSKSFRLVVGATFGIAALAVLVFLIGPANISRYAGSAGGFVGRQTGRLSAVGAVAVASGINDEGRRLWVETATPLPTPLPTATPEPTWTPLPTPLPPRRVVTPIDQAAAPGKPLQPGQPATKGSQPPPLPIDDVQNAMREYYDVLNTGDVRRALQYWSNDAAPEARSALDAAQARGEKYLVRNVQARPLPQIAGADVVVDVEVTDNSGKTITAQQRYQWRYVENQWFITTRLQ